MSSSSVGYIIGSLSRWSHQPYPAQGTYPVGPRESERPSRACAAPSVFCNSPQMGALEACIQVTPGLITEDSEVTDRDSEQFLRDLMEAFAVFVIRVLTVLPRGG
jgi:hypothetical protein